jgi:hypothetical protein
MINYLTRLLAHHIERLSEVTKIAARRFCTPHALQSNGAIFVFKELQRYPTHEFHLSYESILKLHHALCEIKLTR